MKLFFKLLSCIFLFSGCSGVFYQPDRMMYYPPEVIGFEREDIYFRSLDGTRLHAWLIRADAKTPKGTVIQFHGNAQNLTSHYTSLVWLTRHGYNLFTFDYRGYGESLGKPTQEDVYKDGLAALNQAWKIHEGEKAKKFIVYGQSLGGAIAMRAMADFQHQNKTDLLVMDSTFMSYKDVAGQVLSRSWLTWIFSPLGRLLVSDKHNTKKIVPKLKTRLLVIHDKRDPVMDFKNGEELYQLSQAKKDFWVTDYGTHIGIFSLEHSEYREKFLKLLEAL